LREITIKSDGQLCCGEGLGYGINLGAIPEKNGWSIRNILNSPIYRHIRDSFQQGTPPWKDNCIKCELFHSSASNPVDTLDSEISLRIEPTLDCNLSCAFCNRKKEVKTRGGDWHLSLYKLKNLLHSCKHNSINIIEVSYIGWGEPLNHPNFRALVELVADNFPEAYQEVTTVAQADFVTKIGNAPLDKIIISCDGVSQQAYEKYRVRGDLEKVFRFMMDAAYHKNAKTQITWKYILFEHNDSIEEIEAAQKLADEFSINDLLFIVTNTNNCSKKYTLENLADFPIKSAKTRVLPCAALQRVDMSYVSKSEDLNLSSDLTEGYLDKIYKINSGHLVCEGWAIGKMGLALISLKGKIDDGSYVACTSLSEKRKDVKAELLGSINSNVGFVLYLPYPKYRLGHMNKITLQLMVIEHSAPVEFEFVIGALY
jgi:organic radical activating enzyme